MIETGIYGYQGFSITAEKREYFCTHQKRTEANEKMYTVHFHLEAFHKFYYNPSSRNNSETAYILVSLLCSSVNIQPALYD